MTWTLRTGERALVEQGVADCRASARRVPYGHKRNLDIEFGVRHVTAQ